MANYEVKIPEKHYLTFSNRYSEGLPLAFMTPWGKDSASQKRMATADGWASGDLPAKTINNDLMSGFKIQEAVHRYRTQNVLWRIADPRGFELEISSDNMAELLRLTTIERGEILSRCVWAREKARNVLLPEESEEYQTAIANTKRSNTNLKLNDISVGNKVLMQNGEEMVYLGKFFFLYLSYGDSKSSESKHETISMSKAKKHYFYINELNSDWHSGPSVKCMSSPKLSSIIDDSTMTLKESERFINDKFQNFEVQIIDARNTTEYRFIGVTSSKTDILNDMTIELNEIEEIEKIKKEVTEKIKDRKIYIPAVEFVGNFGNTWFQIETIKKTGQQLEYSGTQFHLKELIDQKRFVFQCVDSSSSNYRYANHQWQTNQKVKAISSEASLFIPKISFISPKTKNKFQLRIT